MSEYSEALAFAKLSPFYEPQMRLDAVDRGSDCFVFEFSIPGDAYGGGWVIVRDNGDEESTELPPVDDLRGAKRLFGTIPSIA